jgi:exodeoxyribonuclease V alpha subunit
MPGTQEPTQCIEGTVEKILYSHEENHYTVAQLLPEGRGRVELITIVGNLAALQVGESVRAFGRWTVHKQFGRQFQVERLDSVLPRTIVGIRKYLGSGLVKGIGKTFADRIVEKFGEKTFEVIDHFSGKLRDVEGIGPERARRIKEAWTQQKSIRDIMVFLQGHGVGSAHAATIYKQYGEQAIAQVTENPYRLARDIRGIGFKTADSIASRLGIAFDSVHRLKAGIIHTLEIATDNGHVCLPRALLIESARQLLEVELLPIEQALQLLALEGGVTVEDEYIFLPGLYRCERSVAEKIHSLRQTPVCLPPLDPIKALAWVEKQTGVALAPAQREAVNTALTSKLTVITGGPGVGKTTIINSIVKILLAKKCRVMLAAPTGRAAKRMSEATGSMAQTIHRLLRYDPHEGGFSQTEKRPLNTQMIIIDETSMLDVPLAYHLLKAVPNDASLVFVGDVDQLPSVGPGNFLRDLIDADVVPVVRLTEIFRQAKDSLIITNAHRVNRGQMPEMTTEYKSSDFFFIEEDDPQRVLRTVQTLCSERIPKRFHFDPMKDVQVLTPMHKGVCGSENLNRELQTALNPAGPHVQRFGRTYRVGDRVMQIRNNYDRDVFNGDLGRIAKIDLVDQVVRVDMDGREVVYEFEDMDELMPAYAISVHKSQGNEYPCVVVPLLTQHFMLLQRNLLYTAITRGKNLVVIVGSKKALGIAVRNNKTADRHSRLRERLRGSLSRAAFTEKPAT